MQTICMDEQCLKNCPYIVLNGKKICESLVNPL